MHLNKFTCLLLLSLIFTVACSKDENEDPQNTKKEEQPIKPYPTSLTGSTWKIHQSASSGNVTVVTELTLSFTGSTSGSFSYYYSSPQVNIEDSYPMSYTYAEGNGNYSYTDPYLGALNYDFNISNDSLHIHDGSGSYLLKQ